MRDGGAGRRSAFDALVVCSGATDRLMPVQGWHLAGCYSLGAAQIALKAQACAIGRRIVFLGTGPLLYLVASQYCAGRRRGRGRARHLAGFPRAGRLPRPAGPPGLLRAAWR